jgi:hypothetical protein
MKALKHVAIWSVVFVVVLLLVRTPAFHALTEQIADNPYVVGALFLAWIVWYELGERLLIRNMRRKRYTEAEMPRQVRRLHLMMTILFAFAAILYAGLATWAYLRGQGLFRDWFDWFIVALIGYCAVEAGVQWRRYVAARTMGPTSS